MFCVPHPVSLSLAPVDCDIGGRTEYQRRIVIGSTLFLDLICRVTGDLLAVPVLVACDLKKLLSFPQPIRCDGPGIIEHPRDAAKIE